MKFEKFKEIIGVQVELCEKEDMANKAGITLWGLSESYSKVIDLLWNEILTVEGKDWLDWFLYENDYVADGVGKGLDANDSNGKKICYSLESTYEFLKKNKYFKRKKK